MNKVHIPSVFANTSSPFTRQIFDYHGSRAKFRLGTGSLESVRIGRHRHHGRIERHLSISASTIDMIGTGIRGGIVFQPQHDSSLNIPIRRFQIELSLLSRTIQNVDKRIDATLLSKFVGR